MLTESKEYQIMSLSLKDTQNNTKMAKLQLKNLDSDEVFNCVIWQDALTKISHNAIKAGNIVKITDHNYNKQYNNYIINSLTLIREAQIGLSTEKQESIFNEILELIGAFSNEELKQALSKVIFEHEQLFKTSPAAEKVHHNYIGGLLQHTWECVNLAKSLFGTIYKNVDHELVLAGCIAHDFGKMFEYELDAETGSILRDKEFERVWIDHLHWGFSWANQNGFHDLAHIIASHHGLKEWRALVEPQTPEAQLVHFVDNISARLGAIEVGDIKNTTTV